MRTELLRTSGFTLVEVLIAAVILMAALTAATLNFKAARLNSDQAAASIKMLQVVPLVVDHIKTELAKEAPAELAGTGNITDVHFQWQASTVVYKAAPQHFDVDSSSFETPAARYRLYQVTLVLTFNSKTKEFSYQELAWHAAQQQ